MRLSKKEKLEIIEDVLNHWYTNLMLAYAGDLKEDDIMSRECKFCDNFYKFNGTCKCPISMFSAQCSPGPSYWTRVHDALYTERILLVEVLEHTEAMVKMLERVSQKWYESSSSKKKIQVPVILRILPQ